MYDVILFDLDGTLTDPGVGITNSVAHALKKFGVEVPDRSELYKFIGPPLKESFMRFYGFSEADSAKAVEYYREYFRPTGIFENDPYDGVEDLLKALRERGKKIVLATSKPEEFAVQILEHFGLDGYFDFIGGALMDETRTKKADVIAYALKESSVTDRKTAVMIGDREHDILGAKENGLDSIGVLYGYGDEAELKAAGADHIAANMADILALV